MNRSHHFANLSGLAYKKFNNKLTDQLKKLGYTNIKYIDNGGAQSMVLKNKEEQVIVFRGTEPKQFSDLKADLKAWKIQSKTDGKVHDGFYDEVEKVWSEIVKLLDDKKPLFICGHSLGGAMATVAASRLEAETTALYTYGSPRVGNKRFISNLNVKHYRWRNNNDLVPTVPFWIMGFRHHGISCYLNYYGKVRNGLSKWQRFKDWFRGHKRAIEKLELFDGLRDHGIANYVNYLKNSKL
jgi:triacylglycerol lipase